VGDKDFMDFIKNPKSTVGMQNGQTHFIQRIKSGSPLTKMLLYKNKVVSPQYYDSIVPFIDIDIKGNALYKKTTNDAGHRC
jgi:hypothetical protein